MNEIAKPSKVGAEVESLMEKHAAALAALDAEDEALMTPIRKRLEEIRNERKSLRDAHSDELAAATEAASFDDLMNPLSALALYSAWWNDGNGLRGAREAYKKLFEDAYVISGETFSYSDDYSQVYFAPRVAIPSVKDEAKLARTAEKVEAVHRVNMEILGDNRDAIIDVFDDGLAEYDSFRITFDKESQEWVLSGRYREILRALDLVKVLRKTPTYQ